ncbi:MAG: diguanylate cyclase [Candidatus Thiodiazotropha sp.]
MFSSIRAKILILFVVGMFVIVSAVIAFVLTEVNKHYTDSFYKRGQIAAEDLSNRALRLFQLGLLLDEFLGFEQQCIEIVETNPGVSYAALVDNNGNILYQSGYPPSHNNSLITSSIINTQSVAAKRSLQIKHPLKFPSYNQSGMVLILVDQDAIDAEVNALLNKILVTGFVLTIVGTLIVLVFLRRNFGLPVNALLQHINLVDLEQTRTLPEQLEKRDDEIGTIANTFGNLLQKLVGTQNALLAANEDLRGHAHSLEKTVKERTRELRLANEELQRLAHTDNLTGLPNRLYFIDLFYRSYAHAVRHGHNLAVYLLDLNGFKQINDRYGHAAGDLMLKVIAQRFKKSFREDDTFSRLGGDEFALLVMEYSCSDDLIFIAEKALALISESYDWEGRRLSVGASIGIATLNKETLPSADDLLGAADAAMYEAKRQSAPYKFAIKPVVQTQP